ncbi:MAG: hypothetical protein ABIR39_19805 [Nocardioides sp.]|uniref:hypothetical protein n=1 Tax=Nocardioides sp. TaxID=35761 RepID=UPI003265D665
MGVLDTMATATATVREETLILNAALAARWDELSRQLDQAAKDDASGGAKGTSLALPATTKVVNEMDEIRDQVMASQVTFTFEQMDWPERVQLQAEHPARPGNAADRVRGFNVSTFVPAIIKATCVKVVDAAGDEETEIPDASWDRLLGNPLADPPVRPALAAGQVTKLFSAAHDSNQGESRIPPSARFLLESQDSGASLAQPSPGKSPRSASAAGSPRGSRRSSATKKAESSGS